MSSVKLSNCLFPSNIPSKDIHFFKISQPAEIGLKNKYFEEQVHWVPLIMSISLGWDKVDTIRRVCIVQYRIVFSFHLVKRINGLDLGWDRKVRYCPLFGNRLLGVKLIGWEQNSRWTLSRAKTPFISGVKTGCTLVLWLYIRELEWDECKRKVQRCLSDNRLSFSELFDDTLLVFNVRRLCVVVDSLISALKVYNCLISKWFWQAELRYVVARLSYCTKIFSASNKKVSSVFSLLS